MKSFLVITLFVAIAFGAVLPEDEKAEVELPDYAMTCNQDDPNLNKCIKESLQSMLPRLHKGLKSLNIPPIDPFIIDNSRFEYNNGIIQGSLVLKSVKVYGMSRADIKDVRTVIDKKGLKSEIDIYFPRILIEGNFKADIKLNDIKMTPRGYFNVSMTDVSTTQKMSGLFDTRDNQKYLRMTSFDMEPHVGDMKIYASGLFADPQLNEVALLFINQYWPAMYQMMLPETRTHWEPIMLNAMNEFLLHVPFDKMLTRSYQ